MPAKKYKILFVTSELFPFVKTGGLADVAAALPQTLTELGHEVRIVVPKYGAIDSRRFKIHDVVRLKDLDVSVAGEEKTFSVKSSFLPSQRVRVQIYFIDNEEYFGSRKSLYDDPMKGAPYADNAERFTLFSRAVFELIKKLGWVPDVLHCNDWQSGLTPAFMKTLYKDDPTLKNVKTLFTVHNFSFNGVYPKTYFKKTELPEELNNEKGALHEGKLNFLKAGLVFADKINTVSEGYMNQCLREKELAGGLSAVLKKRKDDLHGLINGIDDSLWNPEKDKFIEKRYSLKNFKNKKENTRALLDRFNLSYEEGVPVIGVVARLIEPKGMDLLVEAMPELMKRDLRITLLGAGEKKYHQAFQKFNKKYGDKFYSYLGFSDELAHLVEAGADMFLMPSRFEPCGLNQMYSFAYGTVPIARQTGGLADTIERYNTKTGEGDGFLFKEYSAKALVKEIDRALKLFGNEEKWMEIVKRGMKADFSWKASAKSYVDMYRKMFARS
ncbi:MAG: glycogen synthase GlgA [Ignavibacteriales bacterium]|jgi:starch synthase|nr:glycogen synthase GlgA [Ignavibacteriales bacterium]